MCNFNGPQTFTKMCGYPVKISHQFKPLAIVSLLLLLGAGSLFAQDQGKYIYGDEQRLQIVVHVLGEVKRPGEYIVPDNTDIVEIISKAGGTTEFSNLGRVYITRYHRPAQEGSGSAASDTRKEIIEFNVDKFLKKQTGTPPPVLQPGDVITVGRNSWSKWRNMATIMRDISVGAYFLYRRVIDNK